MGIDISKQLEEQYMALQNKINEFSKGECQSIDVKKMSSLLGIYKEKDGTYMLRVRRTAGEVSSENLKDIAAIMEDNNIHHGHFSTRQDIQLHGVPGGSVHTTIKAFTRTGMPFRGGGGNTFRNIVTSPFSGVSKTETFDTISHARQVWDWVFYYEKAYLFNRKFKLGFSSEEKDDSNAGIQDLGFVAKIKDGEQGFKVYAGGGMGREASLGIVLFEFLPERHIIRASQAMIDLFYDHGDKENKSKARLRFVLARLGKEEFKKLFLSYYEKADAPDYIQQNIDYNEKVEKLRSFSSEIYASEDYTKWIKRAVKATKFDNVVSVKLYVRKGNFSAEEFKKLADILDEIGSSTIRGANEQNAVIPLVHKTALPKLYELLTNKLSGKGITDGLFKKQIVSCIGAARCSIGILKAPEGADIIADKLEELFVNYSSLKNELYEEIVDGIKVSGCASACGLNLVAAIGFNGLKKRVNGESKGFYQVWIGGEISEELHLIAKTSEDWLVYADEIGDFTFSLIKEYLGEYENGNVRSLKSFMIEKREFFDINSYL